jgi:hypothetical protein
MIKSGQLRPLGDENAEPYFDPVEVARITHVPINSKLSRLVPARK